MYKPLPDSLVIRSSGIEGQGLFAKEKIEARTSLGVTHIKLGEKIIRTPLGGFINHSDDPNCVKTSTLVTNHNNLKIKYDYKKWNLFTIKDIKAGEELTLEYSFYKILSLIYLKFLFTLFLSYRSLNLINIKSDGEMDKNLLDKHFLRKHGDTKYYGQK